MIAQPELHWLFQRRAEQFVHRRIPVDLRWFQADAGSLDLLIDNIHGFTVRLTGTMSLVSSEPATGVPAAEEMAGGVISNSVLKSP